MPKHLLHGEDGDAGEIRPAGPIATPCTTSPGPFQAPGTLRVAASFACGPDDGGVWRALGLSWPHMSEAILVVDDDASIRRMLERTLVAEGYRVEGVADGGAALAAIERSVPDLVILDLGLPGMNGVEVCRRVRARGLATPILMLTARDAMADRVEGLDAGTDDYVVKPF